MPLKSNHYDFKSKALKDQSSLNLYLMWHIYAFCELSKSSSYVELIREVFNARLETMTQLIKIIFCYRNNANHKSLYKFDLSIFPFDYPANKHNPTKTSNVNIQTLSIKYNNPLTLQQY